MTLAQLRSFLAVVEFGSFRRAARELAVSQAGLTSSLQALEQSLGAVLLARSAHGIALTEAGQRLLARAQTIEREVQRALDEARRTDGEPAGTLHVGLGPTPTAVLLHRVVPDFHARHPAVRLKLMYGFHEQLRPALQQGLIELAITALPEEGAGPDLASRPLFRSELAVVAREGHPRARARSLAELAGSEWVLMGTPGGPGGTVTRFHAEQGLPPPRIAATCESATQLAALVGGTDWLAVVPAAMVQRGLLGANVATLKLRERPPSFENCVVHRRDGALSPAARAFAAMCESCARVVARSRGLGV